VNGDPLVRIADAVYSGAAGDFVARRDAAARSVDDRALAQRVKALKKPSVAAWALNQLVRREGEQIEQVLTVGESLRQAAESLDGEELRTLTRQRRQLTAALATTARGIARDYDVRLTPPVVEQVEGMLNAAMLDPVAADVVRTGLVVSAFTSTGVSTLDVDSVLAVPSATGSRATPSAGPEVERPALSVVPEDEALRREKAQQAVADARSAADRARQEADKAQRGAARLDARRLQVQEEIDEVRRRLADLEDDAERVDEELERAQDKIAEAAEALQQAEAAHSSAVRRLDRLRS
jgi:hypothetical protein